MRNKILFGVLIILVCICVIIVGDNYKLRKNHEELASSLSLLDNEVIDLQNQLTINDEVVAKERDELNNYLDAYDNLIIKWFELDPLNGIPPQLIYNTYDVRAVVRTTDQSFSLPLNGYIEVDSDYVELEITVVNPPEFSNEMINGWLHYFDDALNEFDLDQVDDYEVKDESLTIKLSNLKLNDQKMILLPRLLTELLGLDNNQIHIKISNDFDKASAYTPKGIKSKTFSDWKMNSKFTHTYDYLSETEWTVDYRYGGTADIISHEIINPDYIAKFNSSNQVISTQLTWNGSVFLSMPLTDRTILPEIIKLGTSWKDGDREAIISGIDISVETIFGSFKAIEVSYFAEDGTREIICYYAKDIGLIRRLYHIFEDEILFDVEFIN